MLGKGQNRFPVRAGEYSIEGIPSQTRAIEVHVGTRFMLEKVQKELEALLPECCGNAHEQRINEKYPGKTTYEPREVAEITGTCLCPNDRREKNVFCAHQGPDLTSYALKIPISDLIGLKVLEEKTWRVWSNALVDAINANEKMAAQTRHLPPEQRHDANALLKARYPDVIQKIALLKHIVATLLAEDGKQKPLMVVP